MRHSRPIAARLHALPFILSGILLLLPTPAICGTCSDGIIDPGEQCDDGNGVSGDGCSSTCQIEQDCYDPPGTFSFFVWSDANTGSSETGVVRLLTDAVINRKTAGKQIPRFWMGAGDIPFMQRGFPFLDSLNDAVSDTTKYKKYPFACSASSRRFPYFIAVGNHDVDGYISLTPQIQYDYWSNYVGPRLPGSLLGMRNFRWGPSNGPDDRTTYSFDYQNAHFVILNIYHGDPAYPTTDPLGCIRSDLLGWLDNDLASTERPVKFVFGHEPAWSYCSTRPGYGGTYCPIGSPDNLDPPIRPRPYSTTGDWTTAFGTHWRGSLDDALCPPGSRETFWATLERHRTIAYFSGHNHTYSGRLVRGDGVRRNDVPAYGKKGETYDGFEGVWEVSTGWAHTTAGDLYVLVSVNQDNVTFEAFDQIGKTEPFKRIESWSVLAASPPSVEILTPATGAVFDDPATISLTASARSVSASVTAVSYISESGPIGSSTAPPYTVTWDNVRTGNHSVTALATDNNGLIGTSTTVDFVVRSNVVNEPPQISPIPKQHVNEETTLAFTADAWDPDGGGATPRFSLVGAPPGATIDPANGRFLWVPTEAQGPSSWSFAVRATDSGYPPLSADAAVQVDVAEVNRPPVLSPVGDRTAYSGFPIAFTLSAKDPDLPANRLAFSVTGAPPGSTFDPTSGSFSWTPPAEGIYSMEFRVTDDGEPSMSASEPVRITVTAPAPADLVPLSVIPSQGVVSPGSSLLVTDTVSNRGVLGAVPSRVGFHLQKQGTTGLEGRTELVEGRSVPALAGGESSTGVTSLAIPPSTVQGYHLLCATADAANAVAEGNEANNVLCSAAAISVDSKIPDLNIASISPDVGTSREGGRINLTDSVRNGGTLAAANTVTAYFLSTNAISGDADDSTLPYYRNVPSLAAGASSSGTTGILLPNPLAPGSYYLCGRADNNAAVTESNEGNNGLCISSPVVIPPADLTLQNVSTATTTIARNATMYLAYTLANIGGVRTGAFPIIFFLSQDAGGGGTAILFSRTKTISYAMAQTFGNYTTDMVVPSAAAPGDYFVCAKADPNNVVVEGNEGNNVACTATRIKVE